MSDCGRTDGQLPADTKCRNREAREAAHARDAFDATLMMDLACISGGKSLVDRLHEGWTCIWISAMLPEGA